MHAENMLDYKLFSLVGRQFISSYRSFSRVKFTILWPEHAGGNKAAASEVTRTGSVWFTDFPSEL